MAVTVAVSAFACPNTDGSGDELNAVDVADRLTVWVSTGDVEPLKLESPPYTAVTECDPTDSEDVVSVATPPLSVPVPRRVAPSK
ncbi:hypothetical protein P3G67_35725, partial [Streptomyces sp. RB6PN23]